MTYKAQLYRVRRLLGASMSKLHFDHLAEVRSIVCLCVHMSICPSGVCAAAGMCMEHMVIMVVLIAHA